MLTEQKEILLREIDARASHEVDTDTDDTDLVQTTHSVRIMLDKALCDDKEQFLKVRDRRH
jgi:hypothetical protein